MRDDFISLLRCVPALLVPAVLLSASTVVADDRQTFAAHAIVAADHPVASQVGAEVLKQGGNVVDAAVATSFALSVLRPASCGIGGGGFMLIHNAETGKTVALDYRERAPAAATRDMFAGSSQAPEPDSVRGGKAVAVPGTVAGLCYAAENYGTLSVPELLQPAIRLARAGVSLDEHGVETRNDGLSTIKEHNGYAAKFNELLNLYLNEGRPVQTGDVFHSPQGDVLEKIAAEGADAFYRGDIAAAIAATVRQHGGIITTDDLASMQPVVREAVRKPFHGYDIVSMPPPSSGGIALLQTLGTLERLEQRSGISIRGLRHNSAIYVHVVSEAMKHAFADRAAFLGDQDFVDVPVERLLSDEYAEQIVHRINPQSVLAESAYGRFFAPDDGGTSHFSIIDRQGNAVACTETINLTWGSFVVVPEYGILLNNEMDDFAARPGEPNAFGLMQSEANAIAAGKKPLSSMSPTIVLREGKAVFASGASGGPRIISATLQATLNHLVFEMSPADAVASKRFHHQWFPNELLLEPSLERQVGNDLRHRGHKTVELDSAGANQSASRSTAGLRGGSDPRKHGQPVGF